MKFKKSFSICLSMLFTFISLPSQAMKESNETDPPLKNSSSSSSESKKQQDEYCKICLEALYDNSAISDCSHCHSEYHERCLDKWKTYSYTCPKCYISFLDELPDRPDFNEGREEEWRKYFERIGVKDIHDFPEMQGKNDDEIVEFLVKPIRDGKYYDLQCTFQANSPFERQIFYYEAGGGRIPQLGIPLRLQTTDGLKIAAIANYDFSRRVWRAVRDIHQENIRALINEVNRDLQNENRARILRRLCPPVAWCVYDSCALSLLAYLILTDFNGKR